MSEALASLFIWEILWPSGIRYHYNSFSPHSSKWNDKLENDLLEIVYLIISTDHSFFFTRRFETACRFPARCCKHQFLTQKQRFLILFWQVVTEVANWFTIFILGELWTHFVLCYFRENTFAAICLDWLLMSALLFILLKNPTTSIRYKFL